MCDSRVFVSGMFGVTRSAAKDWAQGKYPELNCVELGSIVDKDLEVGFSYVDNDVCISAVAIIGQLMRAALSNPDSAEAVFVVPELCVDCSCLDIPHLLYAAADAAGVPVAQLHVVDIATVSQWAVEAGADLTRVRYGERATLGITGTMAMMSGDYFYGRIVDYIEERGCRAVCAETSVIAGTTSYLVESLSFFQEHGIGSVICLLPFGCMSGFVHARGVIGDIKNQFPGVTVYFLEIDPNASELNMRNRLELIVEDALAG